ncbi:hypothetical protein FOXYSP1_19996 [Fusarium oxysporum f. sp. phaseoli]
MTFLEPIDSRKTRIASRVLGVIRVILKEVL